ncbi:hypothetical protein CAPTEDRAFT_224038 [Capitella teleta]|uniref:Uncharacterized protein n=1 Tax=Capitella teleta TaxID=283909 RepID=R7V125_CAPTE|nr:hypothetical protein CAPTEDRAFT_224038 [Capitella teleta]|eukprot:ELU12553.1 hypothetical protein CAPTEDRAFT_224038 [Capitella teleta]
MLIVIVIRAGLGDNWVHIIASLPWSEAARTEKRCHTHCAGADKAHEYRAPSFAREATMPLSGEGISSLWQINRRTMTNRHVQCLVVTMALIVSMATSVPLNDSFSSTTGSLVTYSGPTSKTTLLNYSSEPPSVLSNSTLSFNANDSMPDFNKTALSTTQLVTEQTEQPTTTTPATTTTTTISTTSRQTTEDAVTTTTETDDSDFADVKQSDEYADDRGFFESDHRVIHQPMTNHLGHGSAYVPNQIHGLIWEEQHYMLSVLIPITCGIIGAFLIVCVAYGLRNCNTDNSHQHRHVAHAIRHRARSLRSQRRRPRVDHTLLLGNSSDEDTGRK